MAKTDTPKKIKELTDSYQELRKEMIDELIKVLPVNVVIKFAKPLYVTCDCMRDGSRLSSLYNKEITPLLAMVVTPHKELIVLDGQLTDAEKGIEYYYSEYMQEIVAHNDIERDSDVNFWFGIMEIADIPFSAIYHIYQDYCMLDRKRVVLD